MAWGGGGGGRIAVYYGSSGFAGTLSAHGGDGYQLGGGGTIVLSSTSTSNSVLIIGGSGSNTNTALTPIVAGGRFGSLVISNGAAVSFGRPVTLSGNAQITGTNTVVEMIGQNTIEGHMVIQNGGLLTHSSGATNTEVRIGGDLLIDPSSKVDVSGKGYLASQGPGAGEWRLSPAGGGGYGGMGGNGGLSGGRPAAGGVVYGSLTQPTDLGSGGGGSTNYAGAGGGSIRLAVGGRLQVEGQLRADGGAVDPLYGGGGGSGGSIYVMVSELRGAGIISADGGATTDQWEGGGGGGGRIAVYYGSCGFAGTLSAHGGSGYQPGGGGTIVLSSTSTSNSVLIVGGSGSNTNTAVTPILAGGRLGSLVVSNGAAVSFVTPVTLSGNVQITGTNTVVEMIGQNSIEQNMVIQHGALLTHSSGATNTEVRIGGDLLIDASSKLDVSGKGYSADQGPGAGEWRLSPAGGGGYGGMGGNGGLSGGRPAAGGVVYGSLTQPTDLGSGGGGSTNYAGAGGGSIRLAVGGRLQVEGQLRADGGAVDPLYGGGGGSGGSIYVVVRELRGAGIISADGGATTDQWEGGGGGGGRIAVYYGSCGFAGTLSARGGSGYQPGGSGTILVNATADNYSLELNHQTVGRLLEPYSANFYTFTGVADQQIKLGNIAVSSSNIVFDLFGPGMTPQFVAATNASGLIDLTNSGIYTLLVRSVGAPAPKDYSFRVAETVQTPLSLGTIYSGQFVGNGQAQLFRIDVPAGKPFRVVLNDAGEWNHNELFVSFGAPPTRGTFDYRFNTPMSPDQSILVPQPYGGTYYVLVYADTVSTPSTYTLQVFSSDVLLTSVSPNKQGNSPASVLELYGAGFDNRTSVELISSNGVHYQSSASEVVSSAQMRATFSSNSLPAGLYSVRAHVPSGNSDTLANAVEIVSGGLPRLETSLVVPSSFGWHGVATIYVEYRNTGNAPMPAPLLVLTAKQDHSRPDLYLTEGAFLTLQASRLVSGFYSDAVPEGFSHSIQILGSGNTAGLLQPGESVRVPVYYAGWQQPWDLAGHPAIQWDLGVLTADDPTPVQWAEWESGLKPASMSAEAWEVVRENFTAGAGTNWGGYVQMLDKNAAYLGQLGISMRDAGQLLAFQLAQADGLSPVRTLASATDASIAAPGLPLVFSRVFPEPISQRFQLGALGRGWSHNWQYSLNVATDATVTVLGPAGSQRVFQPDSRTVSKYFTQAGDHATLTPLSGNAFMLRETDGLARAFRSDGMLDYMEDLNGNRITCGYSGPLLTSVTHSSGQRLQFAYNASGHIGQVTAENAPGRMLYTNTFQYDAAGEHLTLMRYYDGRTSAYDYELNPASPSHHALTNASSSCCNHRVFTYDHQGRLQRTFVGNGDDTLTFSYGPVGLVTATDALNNSSKFYLDHRGLLLKTEDALTNVVSLAFDDSYNLTQITDPAGRSYKYSYDEQGCLQRTIDPLGHATSFVFGGPFNRLSTVIDANANTTHYGNDPKGNLTSITYADNSREGWSYDPFGNANSWTNRRSRLVYYRYNASGLLTDKLYQDGSRAVYVYDARGNLTNATVLGTNQAIVHIASMAYDGGDRLTNITYPGGKWLAFTYDATGRRQTSLDQTGHLLSYYYEAAGRLESMTNELGQEVVRYIYDGTGRLQGKRAGFTVFTSYDYDSAGHLFQLTNANAAGSVLSFFNYTYDTRGRRIAMATHYGTWAYGYDDLGQLTHAALNSTDSQIPNQDLTYAYDALGNRLYTIENGLRTDYQPNNLNQYIQAGSTKFFYDADGNLIREVAASGATKTYTFDDENRLVGVTSQQAMWGCTYDALGNRVATTENGATKGCVVDPLQLGNLVAEYEGGGTLIVHYDYGPGLLAQTRQGISPAYYAYDAIGNVAHLMTSGISEADAYAYSPFGALLRQVEAIPNPFGFIGNSGVIKEANGLEYMRARFYRADLGRFISRDPIGLKGGDANLYRYVRNRPNSYIDALGLQVSAYDAEAVARWNDLAGAVDELNNNMEDRLRYKYPRIGPVGGPCVGFMDGYWDCHDGNCMYFDCRTGSHTLATKPDPRPKIPEISAPRPQGSPGGSHSSGISLPGDPNAKTGPAGFGTNAFITASGTLAYRVDFENQTNASAPAQQVVITDQLSENLDWTTFRLTEVGFGDQFIVAPPNSQHFETNVSASYLGTTFEVQVEVGLQSHSGRIYANFRSIDPATSLPPPVNIGFLPPEDGTGRGQGHVSYTANAKTNLPTGAQLRNVASISFDNLPVITTNLKDPHNPASGTDPTKECLNTIDAGAPTSQVLPLPATNQTAQFTVSWSGTDDAGGSGVATFTIYVSTDHGPWTPWLNQTTNMSASFVGEPSHRYAFCSLATDHVGNQEARALTEEAVTTVVSLPVLGVSWALTPATPAPGQPFTCTITVTNRGSLPARGVLFTNTLPTGVSLLSVGFGRGTCSIQNNLIWWQIGDLAADSAAQLAVTMLSSAEAFYAGQIFVGDSSGTTLASTLPVWRVGNPPLRLHVGLKNGSVQLSWPLTPEDYVLEALAGFGADAVWMPALAGQAPVVGAEHLVTLPPSDARRFFRLRQQ